MDNLQRGCAAAQSCDLLRRRALRRGGHVASVGWLYGASVFRSLHNAPRALTTFIRFSKIHETVCVCAQVSATSAAGGVHVGHDAASTQTTWDTAPGALLIAIDVLVRAR